MLERVGGWWAERQAPQGGRPGQQEDAPRGAPAQVGARTDGRPGAGGLQRAAGTSESGLDCGK